MSAPRSLLSADVNGPLSLQVAVNKKYVQLSAPLHLFAPDSVMGRMYNIVAKMEEEKNHHYLTGPLEFWKRGAWKEEAARRSSLKGRERAVVSQTRRPSLKRRERDIINQTNI